VATLKSGTPNATGTREEEAKRVGDSGVEEERTERERESASKIHTHTHTQKERERERGARDRSLERAFGFVEYYLPPIFPAT